MQPKNKLQTAIQAHVRRFYGTLTDKTISELQAHFEAVLQKLNDQHSRCKPVTLRRYDNEGKFELSFGDETSLVFKKIQGKVEANFNIQTEI